MASRWCSISFGQQVQDDDAQPVDGMEQGAEEDEDLESPVLVDAVEQDPRRSARERGEHVGCHEDDDAQPADAVQDKGQHGTLALVAQGCCQADIPF